MRHESNDWSVWLQGLSAWSPLRVSLIEVFPKCVGSVLFTDTSPMCFQHLPGSANPVHVPVRGVGRDRQQKTSFLFLWQIESA